MKKKIWLLIYFVVNVMCVFCQDSVSYFNYYHKDISVSIDVEKIEMDKYKISQLFVNENDSLALLLSDFMLKNSYPENGYGFNCCELSNSRSKVSLLIPTLDVSQMYPFKVYKISPKNSIYVDTIVSYKAPIGDTLVFALQYCLLPHNMDSCVKPAMTKTICHKGKDKTVETFTISANNFFKIEDSFTIFNGNTRLLFKKE